MQNTVSIYIRPVFLMKYGNLPSGNNSTDFVYILLFFSVNGTYGQEFTEVIRRMMPVKLTNIRS